MIKVFKFEKQLLTFLVILWIIMLGQLSNPLVRIATTIFVFALIPFLCSVIFIRVKKFSAKKQEEIFLILLGIELFLYVVYFFVG